ncbi:MAG: FAD-dependent oxidoreductase [Bacteroidales bacterium]|jgi:NADPH-dependent 2,4-dienoyl-CoA reductase/sulfur reductase-like enzyme/rhodanese-related sulfurtransferase|nr:FAD-dependent oxidoreductase [Bacteroidales bacterium]
MKHIIIGGVAGGATAAARIRRNDEHAEIIMLEKNEYISYANCGLPYYIGDVITERNKLLLQTPDSFRKRYNVDVRPKNKVIGIDAEKKEVTIRKEDGSEYVELFDKLLISTGAKPIIPHFEGVGLPGVFTLRNVNDTDEIKNYIETQQAKNVVIIGAGFIGLEMAENFHNVGLHVSIVEKSKQVNHALDFSMASILHEQLTEKGVDLFLDNEVLSITKTPSGLHVNLKDERTLATDMVLFAIGVKPNMKLAEQFKIKIGEAGGIWVDAHMQTSFPDVYAVGDAVEFPHPLTGKPWLNYMANPANRQAIIAADNMVYGNTVTYEGAIGTIIAKVFDRVSAATGLNAKKLTQLGIPYRSAYTHGFSHSGYYPGATPLSIKIIFDPKSGKLYGGQIVGMKGVDKRIDQLSLIIKMGGTIDDLTKLEQAYAPPFSSAKDPIAIAGYVAKNMITGKMPTVYWHDMDQANRNEITLLDVRTPGEFELGSMPGAMNIPLDQLRSRMGEIPKDKPIYVYCASGMRGYLSQQILLQNGFSIVYNLTGGDKTYKFATQPVILPDEKESGEKRNGKC